jgi:hypothetical protein
LKTKKKQKKRAKQKPEKNEKESIFERLNTEVVKVFDKKNTT